MSLGSLKMANSARIFFEHPLFDPFGYRIDSLQIQKLHKEVHRWLWNGATGGYVQGRSRVGKTTAIEYLSKRIRLRNGQLLPTRIISIAKRDKYTIASVFRNLMNALDLEVKTRDTADTMREIIVHALIDEASSQNSKSILLFVDEMQRLAPMQFNAFAELHDYMRLYGVHLSIIFVANQQESNHLVELTENEDYAHIRGRFFLRSTVFSGIKTVEEVEFCLKQYDSVTSEDQSESFTQYFLPKAFESGWRLSLLAKPLWQIYKQRDTIENEWGMMNFVASVNTLLVDYLRKHGVHQHINEMIEKSLDATHE
jgi:hypothetical protein